MASDLIAESMGYCFLCLNQISSNLDATVSPVHSLQYLTNYLKTDLRKVFDEEGSIPPHLLDKVRKSRLKVELCGVCSNLSKTFSGLYRKLEKIRMEILSCLSTIHGKLTKAEFAPFRKSVGADCKMMDFGKLNIIDVLRKDMIETSSRKLHCLKPRVKLQTFSDGMINAEKTKLKSIPTNSGKISSENDSEDDPVPSPTENSISGDLGDQIEEDYSDHFDQDLKEPKQKTYRTSSDIIDSTKRAAKTVNRKCKMSFVKIYKSNPANTAKRPKAERNLKTGKFTCKLCYREFKYIDNYTVHYEAIHAGCQYKCLICKKVFNRKVTYSLHHQNTHMGIRYKCPEPQCGKHFSLKTNLRQHQRHVHHPQRDVFKCGACLTNFPGRSGLRRHMREYFCGKKQMKASSAVSDCPSTIKFELDPIPQHSDCRNVDLKYEDV